MDKKILMRRVLPVVIVAAIILNVKQWYALFKEKEEVKEAIGVGRKWKRYYCGYMKAAELVIKDEGQWGEVWGKVYRLLLPRSELPKIDFEKEMITAVFMGECKSGGYEIKITKIIKTKEEIVVEVDEKQPSPESLKTMSLTQPYHMVVVKSFPLPVRFQHP